jgi:hypothetical protein
MPNTNPGNHLNRICSTTDRHLGVNIDPEMSSAFFYG